jgi:DNA-binding response OmpR family regulator
VWYYLKQFVLKNSVRSKMSQVSPKAIIIEDDQDLRFIYKLKLEREGFIVATAADGQEGLELTRSFKPDIMLLDLMMPIMGGAEMLALLRSQDWGSSIRVIILTNISKDEAPQSLRFLHVDRYIVKAHHTPAQVVSIVHEILGKNTT